MATKKKYCLLAIVMVAIAAMLIIGSNSSRQKTTTQSNNTGREYIPLAYTEDLADPNVDGYTADVIMSGRIN